ncbi:MAG: hypothetical protein II159_02365 [Bacteroidales bacterium]|nr:hypothetical protein [Bacteroidales bacterium]
MDKKQADTSKDFQESYLEFLGTLNAVRDYAKNNPSTRVEIRNTMYEIYGKKLYGSDKKEYLEEEGLNAMKKAAALNDQTLLAELYGMMANLTSEEPLRSAIYDSKAIDLLMKKGRENDFYPKERYSEISRIFFDAEDYRDAIKYGNLYLEKQAKDTSLYDLQTRLATMNCIGTSYMETNQWDSCHTMFTNMMEIQADSLWEDNPKASEAIRKLKETATGKTGIVLAKWQQLSQAKEILDDFLKVSLQQKDTTNIIYSYIGLGMVHSGSGEAKKALAELKQARRFATTKRHPSLQRKVYDELERAFEEANMDDSASVCKSKIQILDDKVQASRQNLELLKTKTEHELLQIQNDLDTVHKEKVSKRSWSWLIVLILILLGIIALLVAGRKRFRMKIHRRLALQHEEKQKRIAEGELGHLASDLKDKGLIDIGGDLKDLSSEDAWVEFRQKFSGVYPQFFANLDKALGKKASPAYEKVAALLYIKMDNSQIGRILSISKDSVARCKRRLRTDIGCEDLDALMDIISKL